MRKKIISILKRKGKKMSISEIYSYFPNVARTTVRGRVNENIGKGITRIGRGLYISTEAIVELGDSIKIIDRMVEEGDKFDFVFLDIPYEAGGTKGGKRDLFELDTITPEQFDEFMSKLKLLLRTDTSPVAFMFTSGKSSIKQHDKYFQKISSHLQLCAQGSYEKLWKNGNPMNMGKYKMPEEHIYVFTKSGEIKRKSFSLAPDLKEYPTAKPYDMIKSLVAQLTKVGQCVFDPFGGSGKTLAACLELRRRCHIIDSSEKSIEGHILPIL